MNYFLYFLYAVLIIGPIYLIWAISQIKGKVKKADWLNSIDYTVLRIDVPRNNDKSPLAAEQMFASIHGIYSESAPFQNHLSFEIVSKEKYIQFFVYVPVHLKEFVEGQIYAQYPTVEISEVEDYSRSVDFSSKSYAQAELLLTKPDVYPVKLFSDFEVDPISGITSVMSNLNPGEEIWFQLLVRPVGDEWQERGHAMVSAVRAGKKTGSKSFTSILIKSVSNFLKAVLLQAFKPGAEPAPSAEVKLPGSVEEALKCIEQKITRLGFESRIRIMAFASDSLSAKLKCENVAAVFKQFNTTNLNGFRIGEISVNDNDNLKNYIYRNFGETGSTFNISELAAIYHFPHTSVSTPNIVWSGSKKGEPPANLPIKGSVSDQELTIIGETNFRNSFSQFGIKKDDRRRHIYIIGKSGVGKSVLIENMAIDDIVEGRGVIVVDPHGELAEKLLSCIPSERVEDVIVFDPSDRAFPIAFNLLEHVDDDFKGLVASGFVGIFKKIFGDSWGPRLEHILRNTVLALLDYPDSTMLDIPRMLTGTRFREKVVASVKDPVIKDFWLNEFAQYDSKFRTEAVSPILNKVGQFLASSTIRNIVGQPKSRINIREIMDKKQILIVNLSRGKIGEDNSALLGAMMITKIQLAAMSRADVPIEERPDSYLYVDEFQNFATDSFAVILAEARKYNLNLTMAHQYIAQMPEAVRDAVFGNAGTIISFRVGGTDAAFLVKEFEPIFEANDLVNLDKYHIYTKLLVDGITTPAFSAQTLPPVQKLTDNLESVLRISRGKFSNPREQVEASIETRSHVEEEELRSEAELYKTGGLEALLLKKSQEGRPVISKFENKEIAVEPTKPVAPAIVSAPAPITGSTPIAELSEKLERERNEAGESEKNKNRPIRPENIINGRVYKERTARGGVKWFMGEEINEEKLKEKGIVIDDETREMIELSKKAEEKKSDRKVIKGEWQALKKVEPQKEDEVLTALPATKEERHGSENQNLPAEIADVHPMVEESKLPVTAVEEVGVPLIQTAATEEKEADLPIQSHPQESVEKQDNNVDSETQSPKSDELVEGRETVLQADDSSGSTSLSSSQQGSFIVPNSTLLGATPLEEGKSVQIEES